MRAIRITAQLIAMTLLLAQGARASTLLAGYTDLTDWQAAVAQTGLDDFEGISGVGNASLYANAGGYTDPIGINFVGAFQNSGFFLEAVNGSMSQYYNLGSGNGLLGGYYTAANPPYILLRLPANVTAIALDLATIGGVWPVTLTASDGTSYTIATTSGQRSFYGFTFSAPITSLKITIPGASAYTYALIDNVRIGTVGAQSAPVPETASMFMIGIGLTVLAYLKKRQPPATM